MVKDKKIDFKTDEEYHDYMSKVDIKFKGGESLTKEEIDNFCFALPYNEKKKLSICDNDRFEYLYLHILDNGATRPKLTNEQIGDYNIMILEWQSFLDNKNSSDNKEIAIKTEYNYENKNLIKDYKGQPETDEIKRQIEEKRNKIVAFNRYIYQKGLDIFPFYEFPVSFVIDKKEVFLDEFILFHSLIRHYGEIIKQTSVEKSYFTEDVLVEDIYDLISRILKLLIEKKIVIENIISIPVEYKSKPYQLYTKRINGKYRMNSFFPLEDPTRIKELEEDYKKVKLDDDLYYFDKK